MMSAADKVTDAILGHDEWRLLDAIEAGPVVGKTYRFTRGITLSGRGVVLRGCHLVFAFEGNAPLLTVDDGCDCLMQDCFLEQVKP